MKWFPLDSSVFRTIAYLDSKRCSTLKFHSGKIDRISGFRRNSTKRRLQGVNSSLARCVTDSVIRRMSRRQSQAPRTNLTMEEKVVFRPRTLRTEIVQQQSSMA